MATKLCDDRSATEVLPRWDLGDLYADMDDPQIKADIEAADHEAQAIERTYKGRLHQIESDEFASLIGRYDSLQGVLGKIGSFAQLNHAAQRDDEQVGRFYQSTSEQLNAIGTRLLFVTLEINKLDDESVERLLTDERSARYLPWIKVVRAFQPHQLSDEVETKLHEKAVVGRSAWVRLFDETMADLRFPLDDQSLTSAEIFDKLASADRDLRERAAKSIAIVLQANIKLFARINNTLIKDKHIDDVWREFAGPMSARNLGNQVEDDVVEALIHAVRDSYPRTSHRYYEIKAKWMGLDRLQYWDRNAPLPEDNDTRRSWHDAQRIVVNAYEQFSPTLAQIVETFFEKRWIDPDPRPGKDSGAFCHPTVPSVHPYVLMNFQGRNRDVMTLAHELGHGVHQVLASKHGPILSHTPLTMAETASVFGEQLTFRALLNGEQDPIFRQLLLARKIEDMINTVVRQIAFCDFEQRVHLARRDAELTPQDFARIWMEVQQESLGPSFKLDESYSSYWSYVPHFLHVPFYVYAYAFGDCLVNSLYRVFQDQPAGFEAKYVALLESGGTKSHKELLAPFGLDARASDFWRKGLLVLEELIDELERERAAPRHV